MKKNPKFLRISWQVLQFLLQEHFRQSFQRFNSFSLYFKPLPLIYFFYLKWLQHCLFFRFVLKFSQIALQNFSTRFMWKSLTAMERSLCEYWPNAHYVLLSISLCQGLYILKYILWNKIEYFCIKVETCKTSIDDFSCKVVNFLLLQF